MVETERLHAHVSYQYLRKYLVPIEEALHRSDLHYPDRFIYAGGSSSRLGTFRLQFPGTPVIDINVDPEPLEQNIARISLHKAGRANEIAPHIHGLIDVVIGIDTLTRMQTLQHHKAQFIHRGKPETLFDIPRHFQDMRMVSTHTRNPPCYFVDAHTSILYRNGNLMLFEAQSGLEVKLKKKSIIALSTTQGLIQYLLAFQKIYKGILDPKMVLDKISGGIDLLPLVYMDAVEELNGVSTDHPDFPHMLRFGTFLVTVGFAPQILQLFGIKENEAIPNGNFIDIITQRALKGDAYPHQIIRR